MLSKTQVDKLGERLKQSGLSQESDLILLENYRESFAKVYEIELEPNKNGPAE